MKNNQMSLIMAGVTAACLLLGVTATQAQDINFDVPGSTEASWNENNPGLNYNFGNNYIGQGALSDPGNNFWNAVQGNGTTSGGLLSDGVTSSSITLTTSGFTEYGGNSFGNSVVNGTAPALFTPFVYGGTLTLNNVAAGTYDLFVYAQNGSGFGAGNNAPTSITVDGNTLTTALNDAGDYTSFTTGVNYEEFTGIELSGSVPITLGGQANFNGLQLDEITATPEPGTFALAGFGLVCLIGLRSLKHPRTIV
jgi:hypothetical protein